MKQLLACGLGVLGCFAASAQSPPTLAVDATANVHAISPYIYGINEWSDNGLLSMMRVPLLRWGGNDATSFNWQANLRNSVADWYFENYTVSPGFDAFHSANLAAGTVSMGTVSLMDWLPNSPGQCSFSVKKYGTQKATDPYNSDCGNGVLLSGAQQKVMAALRDLSLPGLGRRGRRDAVNRRRIFLPGEMALDVRPELLQYVGESVGSALNQQFLRVVNRIAPVLVIGV